MDEEYFVIEEPTEETEVITEEEDVKKKLPAVVRYGLAFISGAVLCAVTLVLIARYTTLINYASTETWEYFKDLEKSCGKYYQILKLIGDDPLSDYEPKEIDDDRIRDIVAKTGDPYAEYFTAAEYEEFEKKFLSDYVGIGAGVMEEDGKVMVGSVFEGSPADEAGLKSGDVIINVDGKEPSTADEAVKLVSGDAGTEVTVRILRDGNYMDITMTREKIEQQSVDYSEVEGHDKVGYIRLLLFRSDTARDFKLAVRDLRNEGCDRYIIDLRDNGGGLTDECIEIADYLLPACRIMTDVRKDGSEKVYSSDASSADLECAVLVNRNTASASEILTGALQDNDACTVIGEKTYGKGVTQVTHKFRDGSVIKLTDSEYFRPSGEKVQGVGITPDIEADGDMVMAEALKELEK